MENKINDTVHTSGLILWIAATVTVIIAVYWGILHEMVLDWIRDDNNSHGFIVPLVSAYLLWSRRDVIAKSPVSPSVWGLAIVLVGLALLIVSWLGTEFFTMRLSFVVVLTGCIVYWFGWKVMVVAAGPIAYLILMIPIPAIIYDAAAFPLKLFVTKFSVAFMKMIGIMVDREGNIMAFPNITLEVVNACSGLRSLTSLLAVGLAYIMLFVKSQKEKVILLIVIFPVALLANMVRVIGTGVLAQYYGADAAEGFFHEFAGMVIFLSSLAMLFCCHTFLARWSK